VAPAHDKRMFVGSAACGLGLLALRADNFNDCGVHARCENFVIILHRKRLKRGFYFARPTLS
jgi:hypothetical protein